ncbi:MAG: hypothetical protein LBP62_06710 [Clostridiales bacterium]|jgi:hypothetical protein|nr:hypothetical protein [Clostridiales bacterium]
MKYVHHTIKYLKNKNRLFKLLILTAVPAVYLGFFAPLPDFDGFLFNFSDIFASENEPLFGRVFAYITGLNAPNAALLILTIPVCAVTLSYVSAIIERDMHVGDFRYVPFGKSINNNFYPYLIFVFFAVAGLEFLLLSAALLSNLWIVAFKDAQIAALIFSAATLLLCAAAIVGIFSVLLIWPALMTYTGMKPFSALAHILRAKKGIGEIIAAAAFPIFIFGIAELLLTVLYGGASDDGLGVIFNIVESVLMAFAGVYLPALINTVYYDISGLEREDLKRQSIWSK